MTRWIFVLAVLAACGGGDDDEQPSGTPMPTEVGTPLGEPVTATIGPEGGTLVSADGAATLVVPPGSLATATELGIQPITNLAWASTGGAYRLTPDGITFDAPVELQLRYDPAALIGTAPGLLAIAYQNADRFWAVIRTPETDTTQQHVRVALTHFTDFATVEGARLIPDDDMVRIGERTTVRLNLCFDLEGTDPEPLVVPCIDASTSLVFGPGAFAEFEMAAVNGILNGDAVVGTIPQSLQTKWLYEAPARVPAQNPVSFSVPLLNINRQVELIATDITVIGDEDIWAGTATYTLTNNDTPGISNTQVTRAEVTWTFDEELNSYTPSGTVEYTETGSYDNPPGPPCQISASHTGPINPFTSNLQIDEDSYAGSGVEINVMVARTDSCQGTTMFPIQIMWMPSKNGPLGPDGDTIDLDETSPGGAGTTQHVEYHYTKQ